MAQPWKTIERVSTDEGILELRKRGEGDFLITVDGAVLMNSRAHRSEAALGQLACAHLRGAANRPRVLIGGLGMGFTLKAVLDMLPSTGEVSVAELNPVVIKWCRGALSDMTDDAVADKRVKVEISDVAHVIRRYAGNDTLKKFDTIILDLYTGPYVRTHKQEDPLFGHKAIMRAKAALKPGGIFAVWGENYDAGFAKRLTHAGFGVKNHRPGKSGFRHVVYLGKKGIRRR